ncbi:hypothetical protein Ancab_032283 [Ancistrocladus abbreviatus]
MAGHEVKERKQRGCIKATKGPWIVHRTTKKGTVTSLRFPTEGERQKNKERERRRREITRRIFAGLRAHGNYNLPPHADNNDILRAVCEEAGWLVLEDGSVCRKNDMETSIICGANYNQICSCTCVEDQRSVQMNEVNSTPSMATCAEDCTEKYHIDLTLALSLPS